MPDATAPSKPARPASRTDPSSPVTAAPAGGSAANGPSAGDVEVRIPTILRTYTSGSKSVRGSGSSLAAVIDDLETRYPGLRERLVDDGGLRRFVNVYVNDEDVRFLGGLSTPVQAEDVVTVLPAVAGG